MITLQGKSVFKGICIGRLSFYGEREQEIERMAGADPQVENRRFEEAREKAVKELRVLHTEAVKRAGEAEAAVFEVHELMLEDQEYCNAIHDIIGRESVNAEYAISVVCGDFYRRFRSMEDAYLRERAEDVADVSSRLLRILNGKKESRFEPQEPVILVADDLAPSETIQLPAEKILGFCLRRGSVQSHTAILARGMGLPAIVDAGPELRAEYEGRMAVIDGAAGTVYIDPDEELLTVMRKEKQLQEKERAELAALAGKDNITLDGVRIKVYANAGSLKDVEGAIANDAGGIGLLRSELLYLEGNEPPDEERQYGFYKSVLERMEGRPVIIRTMDIGADKQASYLHLEREDNPALGLRAIRICLSRPELFKTQLRALYRAGVHGSLSIMYPMITSLEEMHSIHDLEREVRAELAEQGIPYAENVPTGIMVETPAAALISGELAREADFFSIGTNDLTQYTLAADRQNARLDAVFNPRHEAVLRLIEMTVDSAKAAGIPVGICGELAADLLMTERFLRLGLDELSVSPGMVLPLRKRVRELDLKRTFCGEM